MSGQRHTGSGGVGHSDRRDRSPRRPCRTTPHLTEVHEAAFSPTGDRLVASLGSELWMFSTERLAARSVSTWPRLRVRFQSTICTFTPDGETLIGTGFSPFRSGGHRVHGRDHAGAPRSDHPGAHPGGVNDLALNQDGTLLASAGVDGVVRVWDVATRSLLHQIPVSSAGEGVGGVDFVGDTQHLLVTALDNRGATKGHQ